VRHVDFPSYPPPRPYNDAHDDGRSTNSERVRGWDDGGEEMLRRRAMQHVSAMVIVESMKLCAMLARYSVTQY
jgi:hypothetical protein